jgi:hypothetical protein
LIILASGYFDWDLTPHPGRLLQFPTKQDIQYLLTFLLTNSPEKRPSGKYYQWRIAVDRFRNRHESNVS